MSFGFENIGKDSPKWLKRLSDFSVLFLGAFAVYSSQIPDSILTPDMKNLAGSTATFLVSILKGVEMLSAKQDENEQP